MLDQIMKSVTEIVSEYPLPVMAVCIVVAVSLYVKSLVKKEETARGDRMADEVDRGTDDEDDTPWGFV